MNLRKLLLISFIFSGIAALIYELTWIRPLQFLLGSTVYTISIIFAAFMFGLALGSLIISKYVDKIQNLPQTYALMMLGIGLYGVLLLSIFNLLPQLYNKLYFMHTNFYLFQFLQFALVFIILLIPTTLMGATFPVIAKFYTQEKIGKGIGEVYSANNLGAIIGSFGAGFILIPLLGIKASIIFAGAINVFVAGIIIAKSGKEFFKKSFFVFLVLFLVLAYFGNYNVQQMHTGGFYRTEEIYEELGPVVYYKEGLYATITVRDLFSGAGKALFINGKGQGGTEITDLRVNFLLAYLPELINPEIENALVIGLGTGTNLGTTAITSGTLISTAAITLSGALYSKEFFELVKDDLDEDGLFVKWVPIYLMSPEDFKSFYKTFNSVFPYNLAFANIKPDEDTPVKFGTSEIILVGSKKKIEINEERFIQNYNSLPELSKQHLSSIRLASGDEIYHLLLFTSEQMQNYADDAKLVTDDNLILEFSTAKKVLNQEPEEVINDIEKFISE